MPRWARNVASARFRAPRRAVWFHLLVERGDRKSTRDSQIFRVAYSPGARQWGKASSHAEAPEREAKRREYQPNDKCATHSAAKGPSQIPAPLCLVRHLLECDNTA